MHLYTVLEAAKDKPLDRLADATHVILHVASSGTVDAKIGKFRAEEFQTNPTVWLHVGLAKRGLVVLISVVSIPILH